MGIAQGGAFSGLLANLVLISANRTLLDEGGGQDDGLFYARYVDDKIIVYPDRHRCGAAFARLHSALTELRLP